MAKNPLLFYNKITKLLKAKDEPGHELEKYFLKDQTRKQQILEINV